MRSAADKTSARVGSAQPGATLAMLELKRTQSGTVRGRTAHGWVTIVTNTGKQLLQKKVGNASRTSISALSVPELSQAAVPPELHDAFLELFQDLCLAYVGTPPDSELQGWRETLARSPAEVSVKSAMADHALHIEKVLATTNTQRRNFEQRLVFTCVYGRTLSGEPLSFLSAFERVSNEAHEQCAAVASQPGPFLLKTGQFDDRHRLVRSRAYPYTPACGSEEGYQTIDCMTASGSLLGYICVDSDGYADDLAVLPAFHGRGIGKALVCAAALQLTTARGALAELYMHVRAANHSAIGLYKALGFTVNEKSFPEWYDWHGGYEICVKCSEVATLMPQGVLHSMGDASVTSSMDWPKAPSLPEDWPLLCTECGKGSDIDGLFCSCGGCAFTISASKDDASEEEDETQ